MQYFPFDYDLEPLINILLLFFLVAFIFVPAYKWILYTNFPETRDLTACSLSMDTVVAIAQFH